jgi:hypothetical protein
MVFRSAAQRRAVMASLQTSARLLDPQVYAYRRTPGIVSRMRRHVDKIAKASNITIEHVPRSGQPQAWARVRSWDVGPLKGKKKVMERGINTYKVIDRHSYETAMHELGHIKGTNALWGGPSAYTRGSQESYKRRLPKELRASAYAMRQGIVPPVKGGRNTLVQSQANYASHAYKKPRTKQFTHEEFREVYDLMNMAEARQPKAMQARRARAAKRRPKATTLRKTTKRMER